MANPFPSRKPGRPRKTELSPEQKPVHIRREADSIPLELQNFDKLPGSAFVRLPVVRGLHGNCSASTIWRRVKDGSLPSPVKLSENIAAWRVSDLREALQKVAP